MSRTFVNLIAVAVASAALLLLAATELIASAVLDRGYALDIELPRADGLLPDKEVTYNGVGIGQIEAMQLTDDGVLVTMRIDEDVRIPTEHDVVILRSSPIGEQAIDFRPVGAVTDATEFYEPGDRAVARNVTHPPPVQDLLELASDVFRPVDPDNAGIVVAEMADAVRGRRDDVRSLMEDSARFSGAVADNGEAYDRLFAASRIVNRTLAENRDTLARLITESADATSILSDMREDFEGLLVEAPPTLSLASDLVYGGQANLSCAIDDFATFNEYLAQPRQLENGSEALRKNQLFFEGFNVISPSDSYGLPWQRVHVVMEPEPPPESYLPAKRPIPDILPGGACSSPFGEGAPAASEAGYAERVPEARLLPPADNRLTPVRRDVAAAVAPAGTGATSASAPPPRSGPLPATGASVLPVLLGALTMVVSGRTILAHLTDHGHPRKE
jgi:virulence factor Mce-like protein